MSNQRYFTSDEIERIEAYELQCTNIHDDGSINYIKNNKFQNDPIIISICRSTNVGCSMVVIHGSTARTLAIFENEHLDINDIDEMVYKLYQMYSNLHMVYGPGIEPITVNKRETNITNENIIIARQIALITIRELIKTQPDRFVSSVVTKLLQCIEDENHFEYLMMDSYICAIYKFATLQEETIK
jgi:hypothetical protein